MFGNPLAFPPDLQMAPFQRQRPQTNQDRLGLQNPTVLAREHGHETSTLVTETWLSLLQLSQRGQRALDPARLYLVLLPQGIGSV